VTSPDLIIVTPYRFRIFTALRLPKRNIVTLPVHSIRPCVHSLVTRLSANLWTQMNWFNANCHKWYTWQGHEMINTEGQEVKARDYARLKIHLRPGGGIILVPQNRRQRYLLWCQTAKTTKFIVCPRLPISTTATTDKIAVSLFYYNKWTLCSSRTATQSESTTFCKSNPPVLHPCMHAPLILFQSPLQI